MAVLGMVLAFFAAASIDTPGNPAADILNRSLVAIEGLLNSFSQRAL
jgi:hypothetical protein